MKVLRPDFTVEEAGDYLGVGRKTIYRLLARGDLRGRRTCRKAWAIPKNGCDDLRARQEAEAAERAERKRKAQRVLYRGTEHEHVPFEKIPMIVLLRWVDVLRKLYPSLAHESREQILHKYRYRIERATAAACLGLGGYEETARLEGRLGAEEVVGDPLDALEPKEAVNGNRPRPSNRPVVSSPFRTSRP